MRRFDIISFLFSLFAAIIAFFGGEFLINSIYQAVPDEILVGLYFVLIGIIIVIVMGFCVYKVSNLKYEIPVINIFLKSMLSLIGLTIVISFILGAGFEFLYSLGYNKINFVKNNYIAVIDNSGSMANNDPQYERFDALNELFLLMKDNQKMGVYVFSDVDNNIIPLQNIDKSKLNEYQTILNQYKFSDGGTNLMPTLENIIDYIDTQNVKGGTSVIVISDGECEVNNNTLNKFNQHNIPIHTIGVKYSSNSLYNIAFATGGNYYDINNLKDLGQTFTNIYNLQTEHILLGHRKGIASPMLRYIAMRILFISLLAFAIKLMELFIFDIKDLRKFILIQCILFSIIAGVSIELLMQHTSFNASLNRFVMVLFISLIFATFLCKRNSHRNIGDLPDLIDYDQLTKSDSTKGTSKGISDEPNKKRKSLK